MKTEEELTTLKGEVETLNKKLRALSDDELEQVAGACWQDMGAANGEQQDQGIPPHHDYP